MSACASAPVVTADFTSLVASKPSIRIDAPEVVERWWKNVRSAWPETEGSYFEVVGFAAFEKPDDAIARQSVFQAAVRCFLTAAATAATAERRVVLVERLFEYLLRPEYAAYHRRYTEWRCVMRAKCDELCADYRSTSRLRGLCRRFQRLYPDIIAVSTTGGASGTIQRLFPEPEPEPEPEEVDWDRDPEPVDCY